MRLGSSCFIGPLLVGWVGACTGNVPPQVVSPKQECSCAEEAPQCEADVGWMSEAQSTVPRNYVKDEGPCLIEVGCPFVPANIPNCPPTYLTSNWQEHIDEDVIVAGLLERDVRPDLVRQPCTEASVCCKTNVGLTLRVTDGLVSIRGGGFSCVGDLSLVCCGFDMVGGYVLVRGKLLKNDEVSESGEVLRLWEIPDPHLKVLLSNASICRMTPEQISSMVENRR